MCADHNGTRNAQDESLVRLPLCCASPGSMRPSIDDNPNQSDVRNNRIMNVCSTVRSHFLSHRAHQGSTTMQAESLGDSASRFPRHHRKNFSAGTVPTRRLLLTAPIGFSQTTWSSQKNIFGRYDYRGPGGQRVTSRANIFGGHDYTNSDGKNWTSRENIFGGQDDRDPSGQRVTSRANIFGGQDYQSPSGQRRTQSNIFGGHDYRGPRGQSSTSRKNIFGGQDYSGRPPTFFSGKN